MKNAKQILIARLEDMRDVLLDRDAIQAQALADESEMTKMIAEQEIEAVRLTHCASVVKQIIEAMDRVDSNEYGMCIECEEEISSRRLEAIPWAARCLRCQEAADRGDGGKTPHIALKERMAA